MNENWTEELFGLMLEKMSERLKQETKFRAALAGAKIKSMTGGFKNRMSATTFMRRHGIIPRRPRKVQ